MYYIIYYILYFIHITNRSFSQILSIKQDCMGIVRNGQTSKCKVLHAYFFSISVCVHICS